MSNLRNLKSEENSSATATTSTMSISSALLQIHERINKSQETLSKLDEVHAKSKSLQSLQPTALDIDDLGPNHLHLGPCSLQDSKKKSASWNKNVASTLKKNYIYLHLNIYISTEITDTIRLLLA